MAKETNYYIVSYHDPKEGKVFEIKARTVRDSTLGLSFISISDFLFQESSVVVNPTEEHLRQRFEKVKSLHVSIYTILSIEEVGPDHGGLKFEKDKSNLFVLQGQSPNTIGE